MMKTKNWAVVCFLIVGVGLLAYHYIFQPDRATVTISYPKGISSDNWTPFRGEWSKIENKTKKLAFSQIEKTHFSKASPYEKNAKWIRLWITWQTVEPKKGYFDFSYLDEIVKNSHGAILLTVMPFANWDQDKCYGSEYYGKMPSPEGKIKIKVGKPCNMTAYKNFLKTLVERYDGDNINDMPKLIYPIKYWEIMNEPGMQGENLKFFHGTPQDYLEILKASYEAIKEADPEAKVVMGGMAGMHDEFVSFWDPIIEEAGNYFDIANIHSIDTTENREDMFVLKFKQFLSKHNVKKPIWITEAQFGALGFLPWKEPTRVLSEEEINPLLVRATVLSLALGAEKIFFISDNWYDSTFKVYHTLVEKLNDFKQIEVINQSYFENPGKDAGITSEYGCYKFISENKIVYVAWGTGSLASCISGKVKITDIYGNERIEEAGAVKLSYIPIFIEKP